jgi:hypothetical protein
LAVIAIILGGGLAYVYSSSTAEISSLKQSGLEICNDAKESYNPLEAVLTNGTNTLRQQVTEDDAMIASLNSTILPGYESVVATLAQQVNQDKNMLNLLNNLLLATTEIDDISDPCASFGP